MLPAPWYCDNCGKQNGSIRYQCQQCRGFNSFDLCDQCIPAAETIHPHGRFQLVHQGGYSMPVSNYMWYTYPTTYYRP